jgi:hypothetical protein
MNKIAAVIVSRKVVPAYQALHKRNISVDQEAISPRLWFTPNFSRWFHGTVRYKNQHE